MHTTDLEQIQIKAKLLKCSEFSSKKTLILISSVKVWGATIPKTTEKTAEELEDLENPEGEKLKIVEFEDSEYMKRKAPEEFKSWKGCETLGLSIGMNKPELDVYVLASGIIYGNGEETFKYLFKAAWLEEPKELPIIGNGLNSVPTIHVRDLARAVKHVVQVKPSTHYLFAVDSSASQLQKDLVKAISTGVGTGLTRNCPFEEFEEEEWAKALKLNVMVRPSKVFLPPNEEDKEEEEEVEEDPEEGEEKPKKAKPIRMEWHCLNGLIGEIRKINIEFNETNQLKPITIFVTGPPCSGKSFYASQIAEYYNIPRISSKLVSSKIVLEQSELGEAIRTKLAELKEEMLEEAENNKKEGEEVNPDLIKPRIPKDLLTKAFRWALSQNPCRNRGYVLDGFPKSYDDAWGVFKVMPPSKDGEDEEEIDRGKMILDFEIFPQSVVEFTGTDEEIIEKAKALPEEIIRGTHYNLYDMNRRLKEYRMNNFDPTGLPTVTDFFTENSVDSLFLHCNDETALESVHIYMERFGKPLNYQTHDEIAEKKRIQAKESEKKKIAEKQNLETKKAEEIDYDKRVMKTDEIKKKIVAMQQKEIDQLERMADHVKGYMLENVYEVLALGLTKVCIKEREDPIDYLAKYLFKHADGIPHPDPYLY